jgi:transcriptional regulator with XRE-family HTH domain
MTKEKLGKQIKALREKKGFSTYEIQKAGLHASLTGAIEGAKKSYTIDSLIKYLEAIGLELKVVEKQEP